MAPDSVSMPLQVRADCALIHLRSALATARDLRGIPADPGLLEITGRLLERQIQMGIDRLEDRWDL